MPTDKSGPDLCFDLETVPFCAPMEEDGSFSPKWQARADKQDMDPAEMAALCPALCQIVGVGFVLEGADPTARYWGDKEKGADYESEKELVTNFFKLCQLKKIHRFITFNGGHFDWPVLLVRAVALGIPVPNAMYQAAIEYRYRPEHHIDVMDLYTLFGAGTRWSLDVYALGILGEQKTGDGSMVNRLWVDHEYDKLREYAAKDAGITWRLYQEFQGQCGLPTKG